MNLAVFDIDGTLIRTNRVEDPCYLEALERTFGFRGVPSDWTAYAEVTDSALVTEICLTRSGRAPAAEELARFREMYCGLLESRLEPDDGGEIPGAGAFLDLLARGGEWGVALATGNFARLARFKLQRAALRSDGLPIATADDAVARTALVQLAVERARRRYDVRRFERVVSVGDAPWDLRTARTLRLPFLAVGRRCVAEGHAAYVDDYLDADRVLGALSTV